MENKTEKVRQIQELEPVRVTLTEPLSKKDAEVVSRSFDTRKNKTDGRVATLPISTIGKIKQHKGFDVSTILGDLVNLYETSILAWSEPEIHKEGHKPHTNIKAYHNYVNKFIEGEGEYYIRFTIRESNAKPGKTGDNTIHSTFVSGVTIYKSGETSANDRLTYPGSWNAPPPLDKKLQQFFDSVKDKTDKNRC